MVCRNGFNEIDYEARTNGIWVTVAKGAIDELFF